jgi:hypothetical protein
MQLIRDLERTRDETLRYFQLPPQDLARTYGPGKWNVRVTGLRTLGDEFEKVASHNEHHLQQIRTALSQGETLVPR